MVVLIDVVVVQLYLWQPRLGYSLWLRACKFDLVVVTCSLVAKPSKVDVVTLCTKDTP